MQLIDDLLESPKQLTLPSKFTVLNGILYMFAGVVPMIWPGVVQAVFDGSEFMGRESSLVRVLGMNVTIVGWFYVFGGRSGGKQFVAATVLDRIVLVPIVLLPMAFAGVFPFILGTFAILDPLLGGMAWYLLARENRNRVSKTTE